MKNLNKIIVLVIIDILCIVSIITFLKVNQGKKNEIVNSVENVREKENEIINTISENTYFQLDECINIYFDFINNNNKSALGNIVIDDYKNQVYTTDFKNLKYYSNQKYIINEVYSLNATYVKPYYIKGTLRYENKEQYEYFIVYYDYNNSTFEIKEIDEREFNSFLQGNVQFSEKNIQKNENNLMTKINFSEEEIVERYFYDYIENVLYYPEIAYKMLDTEYSKKRFGNYEGFKEYIEYQRDTLEKIDKTNIKSIKDFNTTEDYMNYLSTLDRIRLSKFKVENIDNLKRYICLDDKENYYIFESTYPMNYKIRLDTYTIDSENFIQMYNSGNEQKKMQLNIDKFIKMINSKDYLNAYNLLDEGFRNNYFSTVDSFKDFLIKNFYEYNTVKFNKFSSEGEILIYEITLTNKFNQNLQKKLNIIMKLQDNLSFVMSFGSI